MRGVQDDFKVTTVPGAVSVAVCNSIAADQDLLSSDTWKDDYFMIEVMTCKGGCLGGGGQPKSDDPKVLEKRMKAIYDIDKGFEVRKSHENKEVQQFYQDFLGEPLSKTSEEYVHARYASDGSSRDKLMRFLSAVDRRDGMVAASYFAEDGTWITKENETLIGREIIKNFVKNIQPPLPPILKSREERPRHVMLDHAEGTDVYTPNGDNMHFEVLLDEETNLIRELKRYCNLDLY